MHFNSLVIAAFIGILKSLRFTIYLKSGISGRDELETWQLQPLDFVVADINRLSFLIPDMKLKSRKGGGG